MLSVNGIAPPETKLTWSSGPSQCARASGLQPLTGRAMLTRYSAGVALE